MHANADSRREHEPAATPQARHRRPEPGDAARLLALQRLAGNRATALAAQVGGGIGLGLGPSEGTSVEGAVELAESVSAEVRGPAAGGAAPGAGAPADAGDPGADGSKPSSEAAPAGAAPPGGPAATGPVAVTPQPAAEPSTEAAGGKPAGPVTGEPGAGPAPGSKTEPPGSRPEPGLKPEPGTKPEPGATSELGSEPGSGPELEPESEPEPDAAAAQPPEPAAAEQFGTAPITGVQRPDRAATGELYDEIITVDQAGQQELSAALAETLAAHRASVSGEQARVEQDESTQLSSVTAAVASARQQAAGAVAAARAALVRAGATAQQQLAARHQAQQAEATALITEGADRVRNSGSTQGDAAVATAGQVATGVRGQVDGQARDAVARGRAAAAAMAGASPESTAAMRRAAGQVAEQTATEISNSLGSTEADLRAAGPEVRGDLLRQSEQIAAQLGQLAGPVTSRLNETSSQAGTALGQAASAGTAQLDQLGTSVSAGLNALLQAARASIRQRAAAGRSALQRSAQATEAALTEEGTRAVATGQQTTAAILAQVTSRPIRRAMARQLRSTISATLQQGYGMSAAQARTLAGSMAAQFTAAAEGVHESIAEAGREGAAHARTAGADGVGQAHQVQARVAQQLTTMLQQAIAQGDQVVEGLSQSVQHTASQVDQGFVQAVRDLRTRLEQHGREAGVRTGEPLNTLDARIREAADKARRRVEDGWLLSQLQDAWAALTPGFIAGLVVGLLVTIAVVAICGTGIGALILAGALAGAASALASNATDYAAGTGRYAGGREWSWSEVGREMALGAVFGAAGGALGAGVTGAIGARTGSTLLNAAARSVFAEAATQQAATKVANVVLGVGLGVAQNVVNSGLSQGWDHAMDNWDQGLLLNAAVSAVMVSDLVGGRIHAATESARGAMVDGGHAYNVTPAEFSASQARLAEPAGGLPAETATVAGAAGRETEPMSAVPAEGETAGPSRETSPGSEASVGPEAAVGPETETPAVTGETETAPGGTVAEPATGPERSSMQEQVDRVTGVDQGPEHAASMAELREFYENQQREAENVSTVSGTRIDQMVDAGGNPMVQPDGSPYGYGVREGFDVRTFEYEGGRLTEVTMRVRLEGAAGVTPAELAQVQQNVFSGIDQHYNNGQTLPNGDRLHVTVEFVTDPAQAHLNVDLQPGSGGTVQNRWFVQDNPTTLAHELGHQLGFLDEYIDPRTVNRGSAGAPGVTSDSSLMGDFWLRDPATGNVVRDAAGNPVVDPGTQIHDRHLEQLGADIDAARGGPGSGGAPGPAPEAASSAAPTAESAGTATDLADLRSRYAETLEGNPAAARDLAAVEQLTDPQARAEAALQLRRNLAAHDVLGTMADAGRQGAGPDYQPLGAEGTSTEGLNPLETYEGTSRLPRTGGGWDGEPGASGWLSQHPEVVRVTGGEPVPYLNGEPVLAPYAQERVVLTEMTGANSPDFSASRRGLMEQYPDRWRNLSHVEAWERGGTPDLWGNALDEQHTWHHEPDVETMSLVPLALHENLPHSGGASAARAGGTPDRTPVLSSNPL